jgi:hypothetical protein
LVAELREEDIVLPALMTDGKPECPMQLKMLNRGVSLGQTAIDIPAELVFLLVVENRMKRLRELP